MELYMLWNLCIWTVCLLNVWLNSSCICYSVGKSENKNSFLCNLLFSEIGIMPSPTTNVWNCTLWLIEVLRRLHDDDSPLLLSLSWSEEHENGLDSKQFVLKEMLADVVEVFLKIILHFYICRVFNAVKLESYPEYNTASLLKCKFMLTANLQLMSLHIQNTFADYMF